MSSVSRSPAQVLTTTWSSPENSPYVYDLSDIVTRATNNGAQRDGSIFIFPTEAACAQAVNDLEANGSTGGANQPFLDIGKTIHFTVKAGGANGFIFRLFKLGRGNSLLKYVLVSKTSSPAMEAILNAGSGNGGRIRMVRGN